MKAIVRPGGQVLLRERAEGDSGPPILFGRMAEFNRWTEVDNPAEGHFMERIVPGSLIGSFARDRQRMKALFAHGRDPQVGSRPLGPIRSLEEDVLGATYEVELLDAPYVNDLLPGLRAGLYGSSIRFRTRDQRYDVRPGRSDHNPAGLPELTVREAQVVDFGPCTIPVYAGTSAGVRSQPFPAMTASWGNAASPSIVTWTMT